MFSASERVAQFIWFVKIKTEWKMPEVRSSGRAGTRTSFCILWTCPIPRPSGNVLKTSSESIPSMSWCVCSHNCPDPRLGERAQPQSGLLVQKLNTNDLQSERTAFDGTMVYAQNNPAAAGGSDQAVGPSAPAIRFSCMHPGCIDTPGTNGRCGNRGCSSQHRGSAPALINHGTPVQEICSALKPLLWMSVYREGKLSSLGHETAAPPAVCSCRRLGSMPGRGTGCGHLLWLALAPATTAQPSGRFFQGDSPQCVKAPTTPLPPTTDGGSLSQGVLGRGGGGVLVLCLGGQPGHWGRWGRVCTGGCTGMGCGRGGGLVGAAQPPHLWAVGQCAEKDVHKATHQLQPGADTAARLMGAQVEASVSPVVETGRALRGAAGPLPAGTGSSGPAQGLRFLKGEALSRPPRQPPNQLCPRQVPRFVTRRDDSQAHGVWFCRFPSIAVLGTTCLNLCVEVTDQDIKVQFQWVRRELEP
ncbi:dehydrogenase/reductase SDR family member 12 [Phacochoerus africanus]|uniref:dehydrogenase/reductase SDR family member 12 n=1 Tax=Phacochoerus africanus TaxID=41426 RepID=UPI001FD8EF24|nr:dehydrogenase/reductase SDR family member 12 [Phacochoerus africanus]